MLINCFNYYHLYVFSVVPRFFFYIYLFLPHHEMRLGILVTYLLFKVSSGLRLFVGHVTFSDVDFIRLSFVLLFFFLRAFIHLYALCSNFTEKEYAFHRFGRSIKYQWNTGDDVIDLTPPQKSLDFCQNLKSLFYFYLKSGKQQI